MIKKEQASELNRKQAVVPKRKPQKATREPDENVLTKKMWPVLLKQNLKVPWPRC